jgi:toxin ParE1/3/4
VARQIQFTFEALEDLYELGQYITAHDGSVRAESVLARIGQAIETLAEAPDRGVFPRELAAAGERDFREVFFKPHRIIYEPLPNRVVIHVIADGRRNFETLLRRRLYDA